jgi:RNA polymerase sigma factor (sigma-70 family)
MATSQLETFIRHLRRVVRPQLSDGLTDTQLLERFVQRRDEAAFEILVWRHGATVFNVCLRVLHRQHDAEDAFQATFLALVRKASAIGKGESVGSWLYKVAYRVALRARAPALVLTLPKEPLKDTTATDPVTALLDWELNEVLDEEINRLPDKYRVVVVLCDLEGQTIEAAARILGCPPGTVGTRVARARAFLRRRLTRRGVDPSVRFLVEALPATVVASTVKAALLRTADQAVAAGVISAHVANLTKGVLRTMFLTKLAQATAIVLGVSLFGGGALLLHRAQAGPPSLAQVVPLALSPSAKEKDAAVVLKWKFVKDRPFYQQMTTETTQTMKVMNNDVLQTQKQTFYFSWTPEEQKGNSWILKQKIEGVSMDMDIGNQMFTYDSTVGKEQAANPLGEFFKALVGSEFKVTLDVMDRKVTRIEGRTELLKKLVTANPQMKPLLEQVLSNKALEAMAETMFAVLPDGPVRPGSTWTRKRQLLDMGPVGAFQMTSKYSYEGQEGILDKIKINENVLQIPPQPGGAQPFKIKDGELKCKEGTGILFFDRAKGRIARMELNLKLEGNLSIVIGDQVTKVELLQTQKTTVKTTDANPLKPTKGQGDNNKEINRLKEEKERLKDQLQAVEEALRREQKPKE